MKARLVKFGEIEVEGKRYTHDIVIDGGKVAEVEERIFQAIPRKVRATGTSKAPVTLNQMPHIRCTAPTLHKNHPARTYLIGRGNPKTTASA
jgi:hypothetical protein